MTGLRGKDKIKVELSKTNQGQDKGWTIGKKEQDQGWTGSRTRIKVGLEVGLGSRLVYRLEEDQDQG